MEVNPCRLLGADGVQTIVEETDEGTPAPADEEKAAIENKARRRDSEEEYTPRSFEVPFILALFTALCVMINYLLCRLT